MNRNEMTPPVKVDDVIENIECISIGKKGDGVFKHENFIIMVNNAKEGETYNLRITKVLPRLAFAEIIEQ